MKFLTLNCFALPFFSPNPPKRLKHLATEIEKISPDIIFLQELHLPRYRNLIIKALGTYQYNYFSTGGLFYSGGSLLALSKIKIQEADFIPFSRGGRVFFDFSLSDRIVRKGIMRLKLTTGTRTFYCFHTHLVANYHLNHNLDIPDGKHEILWSQFSELADVINQVPLSLSSFIIGDLNAPPNSAVFKKFISDIHARDISETLEPSRNQNLYRPPLNFFSFSYEFAKLDYILYRGNAPIRSNWEYVFKNEFISDHLGILAEVKI